MDMETMQTLSKVICPRCGSEWVYGSERYGIFEQRILRAIQVSPYRCDRCNYRFYRRSVNSQNAPPPKAA